MAAAQVGEVAKERSARMGKDGPRGRCRPKKGFWIVL